MSNSTHDEQIDHYLRCALNVAYAREVDGCADARLRTFNAHLHVWDALWKLRNAALPFTEPSALYGRRHSSPARGEEVGAASDRLVGEVEESHGTD